MGRQNVANIFSMRTGRIDVVNPHDHDKTMVFPISRISPCMFMNIDMMSQCSVFRKTQQVVTASGHSVPYSKQIPPCPKTRPPSGSQVHLSNLLICLDFVVGKLPGDFSPSGPNCPSQHPETMVDVGDETMATRTIEWVTQSLRLES
jgi:hypothetical protein